MQRWRTSSYLYDGTKEAESFQRIPKKRIWKTSPPVKKVFDHVLQSSTIRKTVMLKPKSIFFSKLGHSRTLFLFFRLFNTVFSTVDSQWLDLNCVSLVSEATGQPTEPHPLS